MAITVMLGILLAARPILGWIRVHGRDVAVGS
jgi:hypothetical protein